MFCLRQVLGALISWLRACSISVHSRTCIHKLQSHFAWGCMFAAANARPPPTLARAPSIRGPCRGAGCVFFGSVLQMFLLFSLHCIMCKIFSAVAGQTGRTGFVASVSRCRALRRRELWLCRKLWLAPRRRYGFAQYCQPVGIILGRSVLCVAAAFIDFFCRYADLKAASSSFARMTN